MATQVILVTGASSGFGALTVRALADGGHQVYAGIREMAGRNAQAVEELDAYARDHGVDLHAVDLDVTIDGSSERGVAAVIAAAGRLDVVVHNAGHMMWGPAEAFSPQQLADLYDVNVIGTHRLNRAALPHLRRQGSGLLVWVGSSSTRGGTPPYSGPYFAAKAAMDALAVSYAGELIRFGIDTAIVLPGAFINGTNHFAHASQPTDPVVASDYQQVYGELMDKYVQALTEFIPADADVEEVARAILRVVDMPAGTRPLRTHVDPSHDGSEVVSVVADRIRTEYLHRLGLGELATAGSSV